MTLIIASTCVGAWPGPPDPRLLLALSRNVSGLADTG